MDQKDFEFRKECNKIHCQIRNLIKKNSINEASNLINILEKSIKQWQDYEKSVKFKIRLLQGLYSDVSKAQRIKIAYNKKVLEDTNDK